MQELEGTLALEIKRLDDVDSSSCMHSVFQVRALGVRCLVRVGGAEGSEARVVGGILGGGNTLGTSSLRFRLLNVHDIFVQCTPLRQ
jgi:hypothetical protein